MAYKNRSSLWGGWKLAVNKAVSTTHSYVYVAFSITTSFSALYPGSCLLRDREIIKSLSQKGFREILVYHYILSSYLTPTFKLLKTLIRKKIKPKKKRKNCVRLLPRCIVGVK